MTTFKLKWNTAIRMKVGISETGMAMAVIAVERQSRRNSHTTRAASTIPSIMVRNVAV